MKDCSNREKWLYHSSEDIVKILRKLPQTKHDPYTFTADLLYYSANTAVITVTGVFKDPTDNLLGFTRTFVLSSTSDSFDGEYNIVNEQLHISNATTVQAREAFKIDRSSLKVQLYTNEEKSCIIETLVGISDLDTDAAKKLLENNQWDLKSALTVFIDKNTQQAISSMTEICQHIEHSPPLSSRHTSTPINSAVENIPLDQICLPSDIIPNISKTESCQSRNITPNILVEEKRQPLNFFPISSMDKDCQSKNIFPNGIMEKNCHPMNVFPNVSLGENCQPRSILGNSPMKENCQPMNIFPNVCMEGSSDLRNAFPNPPLMHSYEPRNFFPNNPTLMPQINSKKEQNIICFYCHIKGHHINNCPLRPPKKDEVAKNSTSSTEIASAIAKTKEESLCEPWNILPNSLFQQMGSNAYSPNVPILPLSYQNSVPNITSNFVPVNTLNCTPPEVSNEEGKSIPVIIKPPKTNIIICHLCQCEGHRRRKCPNMIQKNNQKATKSKQCTGNTKNNSNSETSSDIDKTKITIPMSSALTPNVTNKSLGTNNNNKVIETKKDPESEEPVKTVEPIVVNPSKSDNTSINCTKKGKYRCRICRNARHRPEDCLKRKRNEITSKTDFTSDIELNDKSLNENTVPDTERNIKCFACRIEGHRVQNCPQRNVRRTAVAQNSKSNTDNTKNKSSTDTKLTIGKTKDESCDPVSDENKTSKVLAIYSGNVEKVTGEKNTSPVLTADPGNIENVTITDKQKTSEILTTDSEKTDTIITSDEKKNSKILSTDLGKTETVKTTDEEKTSKILTTDSVNIETAIETPLNPNTRSSKQSILMNVICQFCLGQGHHPRDCLTNPKNSKISETNTGVKLNDTKNNNSNTETASTIDKKETFKELIIKSTNLKEAGVDDKTKETSTDLTIKSTSIDTCTYCLVYGHEIDVCLKRKQNMLNMLKTGIELNDKTLNETTPSVSDEKQSSQVLAADSGCTEIDTFTGEKKTAKLLVVSSGNIEKVAVNDEMETSEVLTTDSSKTETVKTTDEKNASKILTTDSGKTETVKTTDDKTKNSEELTVDNKKNLSKATNSTNTKAATTNKNKTPQTPANAGNKTKKKKNRKQCSYCSIYGHVENNCFKRKQHAIEDYAEFIIQNMHNQVPTCTFCRKLGHVIEICPTRIFLNGYRS